MNARALVKRSVEENMQNSHASVCGQVLLVYILLKDLQATLHNQRHTLDVLSETELIYG